MPKDFRTEVFKLCKKVQNNTTSQMIGKLIHDMSVVESKEVGDKISNSKNDFAYIAKHYNAEFYGFVFLDDNIENLNIPPFFKPKHMPTEERRLIEQGHKTLLRFIDLCLSDIADKSKNVAYSMNPYFQNKNIKVSDDVSTLLSDDDLFPAIEAFKNGNVYKTLIDTNFIKIFNKLDVDSLHSLISILEKEINNSLGNDVSKDLLEFSMKLHSRLNNMNDIIFAFSILILAIKASLKIACHLLYRAICGVDLFVLNNENIINIEKSTSTVVSKFYKVLSQDIHHDFTNSEMGSILLIDCDLPNKEHIHEFGMLISQTISFSGEFGESSKYSFVTVNEELINIHHLVKTILNNGLPIVK